MSVLDSIANPVVPNPLTTMGSVMNVANAANQYQIGRQGIAQGQIETEQKQLAWKEQQAITQGFAQHPEWIRPDGTIDTKNVAPYVAQVAPYTGQLQLQKMAQTNQVQTQANASRMALSNAQQQKVSDTLTPLRGGNTPISDIVSSLNQLGSSVEGMKPETDLMIDRINHALTTNGIDPDSQEGRQAAGKIIDAHFRIGNALAQQKDIVAPSYTGIGAGGTTKVGQTNPLAEGGIVSPASPNAPSITNTISPAEKNFTFTDQQGNVWVGERDQSGGIQNAKIIKSAPSSNPSVPQGPVNKTTAEAIATSQQHVNDVVKGSSQVQSALSSVTHLENVINTAPEFSFGPGTQLSNKVRAVFGGANNVQEASAYLDRLAVQALQQSGAPQTNAGLMASQSATGTVGEFNRESLLEKQRQTRATLEMAAAYSKGLTNAVGYGANNDWQKQQGFDSKWVNAANPDVFRFERAVKNNDKAELARLIGPNGAYKTKDAIDQLRAQRAIIQQLVPGF